MSDVNEVLNTETSTDVEKASNPETNATGESSPTESNTSSYLDEIAELKAQVQNLTTTNAKLKRSNDKLSSENGDLNKKYREKLSDEERHNLELEEERLRKAEEDARKDELIATLQREKQIATLEKGYLAMGWTSDEAQRMANADADGDIATRMSIMQEVNERQKKEYDVSVLKNRPPVNSGTGNSNEGDITQAQFNRMNYKQRVELQTTNPELYNKLAHR